MVSFGSHVDFSIPHIKIRNLNKHYAVQGHKILWLPAYSPDLNAIEQMWAWVKRKRKEWLIDSVDELFQVFFESCMNNKVV